MNTSKAVTTKKLFSRETTITATIKASQEMVWGAIIDLDKAASWNTTIVSVKGNIAVGEKVELVSKLDPSRVFKLQVKEVVPNEKLVWGDAMGNRVYILKPGTNGTTVFTMTEKIGGPIFPLFASMIPTFDESFEQFVVDLKKYVEK